MLEEPDVTVSNTYKKGFGIGRRVANFVKAYRDDIGEGGRLCQRDFWRAERGSLIHLLCRWASLNRQHSDVKAYNCHGRLHKTLYSLISIESHASLQVIESAYKSCIYLVFKDRGSNLRYSINTLNFIDHSFNS